MHSNDRREQVEKLERTLNMLNEVRTYTAKTNLTEVIHRDEARGIVEGSTEVTDELKEKEENGTAKKSAN